MHCALPLSCALRNWPPDHLCALLRAASLTAHRCQEAARQREDIHGEDVGALAAGAGPGQYFLHLHQRDGRLCVRRGRGGHPRRGRSRSTSALLPAAAKVSSKSTAVSGKSVGTANRTEAPLLSVPARPRDERVPLVSPPVACAADACFQPSSAGYRARCPSIYASISHAILAFSLRRSRLCAACGMRCPLRAMRARGACLWLGGVWCS